MKFRDNKESGGRRLLLIFITFVVLISVIRFVFLLFSLGQAYVEHLDIQRNNKSMSELIDLIPAYPGTIKESVTKSYSTSLIPDDTMRHFSFLISLRGKAESVVSFYDTTLPNLGLKTEKLNNEKAIVTYSINYKNSKFFLSVSMPIENVYEISISDKNW